MDDLYDDKGLFSPCNIGILRCLLEALDTSAFDYRGDFEKSYLEYFGGLSSSRWHVVYEVVRSGTYSAVLDNHINVAKEKYHKRLREFGISSRRWDYVEKTGNSLAARVEKNKVALEILPWFSIVESDVLDVLESDTTARAEVCKLFDLISDEAGYAYFNFWRSLGTGRPCPQLHDLGHQGELLESGLVLDRAHIDIFEYIRWIGFKELKDILSSFNIPAQRGYDGCIKKLHDPMNSEAKELVEKILCERTSHLDNFTVPVPSGFTRDQLMDLRVRAQTLLSIIEHVECRRLPDTLLI